MTLRAAIAAFDSLLGGLVEILAATLVAAEIMILFSGVVARYAFDHPLVWSDELASMLFLWLAMLGAVIAFRRDEHMRMTAVVAMLAAPRRARTRRFMPGRRRKCAAFWKPRTASAVRITCFGVAAKVTTRC